MKDNHYWEILAQIIVTIVAIVTIMNTIYGDRLDRMTARLTRIEEKLPVLVRDMDNVEGSFNRLLDILDLKPTYKD